PLGTVAAIRLAEDLIRFRTDVPELCGPAADLVEARLVELGYAVERRDAEGIPSVIGWFGAPTDTPDPLLNAHPDTGPAGDGWSTEPFDPTWLEGRLYGRGAALAKGTVAAYVHGAAAAARGDGTVAVAITADEGTGGHAGPRRLLDRGLRPR